MSRFAADPRWLIYLPPTMSPCETSGEPGLLEHPAEAFAYYRGEGVPRVICEEKHMGSRAVVVVCRDEPAARERFGVTTGESGIVTTRTGRPFFNDPDLERRFLDRVRAALTAADLWGKLETSWACLDCELMPWSAKAQELLRTQYAAVGAAGLGLAAASGRCPGAGGGAAGGRGAGEAAPDRRRVPPPGAGCRAVRGRLPAILLAGRVAGRPEAGPVPPAGHRGARPRGQGPPLAHGDPGRGLPGRPGHPAGDLVPGRGRDRPGEPGGGDRLVDGADGPGRRGDGGQAAELRPHGVGGGCRSPP